MATLELSSSANALFASSMQPSDRPDPAQARAAITAALCALGSDGCAARVAQEFGDHPETAVPRMRWARATIVCIAWAGFLQPLPQRLMNRALGSNRTC
jgi:hypothetical protein